MESNDGLGGGGFVIVGERSSSVSKSVRGEVGGVENKSLVGSNFMASGEECLDGWVGVDGGEVKGGGVVFEMSSILLGEILRDIIGESDGEAFGVNGGGRLIIGGWSKRMIRRGYRSRLGQTTRTNANPSGALKVKLLFFRHF
ncbi:hypothetical protein Tco_0089322 [Tanacetum coccineum]